ncbi:hypothetical protein BN59_00772 [Legionella massiliensis]|uniref:Dot/Icm T4SS effector n=1 Tax=Legionella massiliensis TaxID=1034943 RepID=A0A078KU50_9GAMM|nr:hypothetical protein [Legionella massiliensis]CDZ76502.1 hypothetical protein BN59_00772 [Legionella massiliensis]CEE12240.1 hypothetical protein BN1094_00772 [Legionella massiliensis]
MTVRVLSFDFDGCLFHTSYTDSPDRDVIAHNREFFDAIKAEKAKYSQVYTLIGSNRQSTLIDFYNRAKGSCFTAIQAISDYLGSTLDTFLMADIFGDLPDGESFRRATNDAAAELDHADWVFDKTKVTIIYAQLHRIAAKHPGEELVFDFYDDKKDILGAVTKFFRTNPHLLPPNTTLQTHHYEGGEARRYSVVKSPEGQTNIIDKNYRQTVKDLASLAGVDLNNYQPTVEYPIATKTKVNKLRNRVSLLAPEPSEAPDDLDSLKSLLQGLGDFNSREAASGSWASGSTSSASSRSQEEDDEENEENIAQALRELEMAAEDTASPPPDLLSLISEPQEQNLAEPNAILTTATATQGIPESEQKKQRRVKFFDEQQEQLEQEPEPNPELESEQKLKPQPAPESEAMRIAKEKFASALKNIELKASELQGYADGLYDKNREGDEQDEDYYSYSKASEAASDLHYAFNIAANKFYIDFDKKAFNDATTTAISTARDSELKNHRGYAKEIFGYAGLAVLALLTVATAGLAYAVAGGINYAINQRFFIPLTFNTDSINRANDLDESAKSLVACMA